MKRWLSLAHTLVAGAGVLHDREAIMAQDRGPQISEFVMSDHGGSWKLITTVAIYALFLTLAYIFAGLRFYVRLIVTKCWGADDWLLLLALVSFAYSGISSSS